MDLIDGARIKLVAARNILTSGLTRAHNDDRENLDDVIAKINGSLAHLRGGNIFDAADAVVDTSVDYEHLLNSARGPRDDFLKQLESLITSVGEFLRDCDLIEHLERTPEIPPPSRTVEPEATSVPVADGTALGVTPNTDFAALASEYGNWFGRMCTRDEQEQKVNWYTTTLIKYQDRYCQVSQNFNHMPWCLVGIIHAMECGFNFACHLHNGDPLTGRTTHAPTGQPRTGQPPFSWEKSATDALTREGFDQVTDWSTQHMLYLLEKYNGFGYRNIGHPTPYLWSFSNLYDKGKYVADGKFDPEAVSKQCGAAVMLKRLLDQGVEIG